MPPSDQHPIADEDGTPKPRFEYDAHQAAYLKGIRRGYHQCLEDIEEMLRRQHDMVRQRALLDLERNEGVDL